MTDRPAAGAVLADRYEIQGPVAGGGTGGMGKVWQGWDRTLDRPIAVKQIRPDIALDDQAAEELRHRFEREARVTARLRHPGVPQVYDAVLGTDNDGMYLVMELVDGATLTNLIKNGRPPPIPWAVSVVAQIAGVLSYAHAIPVVHRDLKPDNIMVTPDGTVKILDFGTAAILRPDTPRLTVTGQRLGTFPYMAPEQHRGVPVSPHTDLYALGCILHELLTCRPLFSGTDAELIQQHLSAAPTPVRQLRPDVPTELEALTLDLLRKAPEARPADAAEVYRRLSPFLPGRGTTPPSADGAPDVTRVFREPYGPRPAMADEPSPTPPHEDAAPGPTTEFRAELQEELRQARGLMDENRFAQAGAVYAAIAGRAAPVYGADSRQVLRIRYLRANSHILAGDHAAAVRELDEFLPLFRRVFGPADLETLSVLEGLARSGAVLGHLPEALAGLREVYAALRARNGDADSHVLGIRSQIAAFLDALGQFTEALHAYETLAADLEITYGPDHPDTRDAKAHVQRLRRELGT